MTTIKLPGSRKVGHLTLFREEREITPHEFNALSADERLEMVRAVPGKNKYNLIIEAQDAKTLIRKLSSQEVYALVREVGEEDVTDLVEMVSNEQLTTFVDLDAWRTEGYDGQAALRWLVMLAESGEERLWEALNGLDQISLALLFAQFVTVTGGLGDLLEEDRLQRGEIDKIYQVDYKDSEMAKLIGGFLDVIYRRDIDLYIALMELVRTEQGASLEEFGLQQRNGRLLDQGIPDPESAASVYTFLDPERFTELAPAEKVSLNEQLAAPLPGNLLVAARPGGVLAELLAEGLSEELAWELTCLTNKVLVASQADIGNPEHIATALQETYANLEIALGYLCGNDLQQAEQLLASHYLEHIFRLGFSLLLRLQRRARKVRSEVGPLLDAPFARLIEGLAAPRPLLYRDLVEPGRDELRPFRSYQEVEVSETALGGVEDQQRLFHEHLPLQREALAQLDLTGCNIEENDLTLATLLLTSLANRLLGRDFSPLPLPADDLTSLHAMISRDGQLNDNLRRETLTWLDGLVSGSSTFGAYCLGLWEDGICALEAQALDARFVSGLIVRL